MDLKFSALEMHIIREISFSSDSGNSNLMNLWSLIEHNRAELGHNRENFGALLKSI